MITNISSSFILLIICYTWIQNSQLRYNNLTTFYFSGYYIKILYNIRKIIKLNHKKFYVTS